MDQSPPSLSQSSSAPNNKSREWSIKEIRDLCLAKLGKRPCWYQIQIALQLRAGRDVVGCARTGVGKTLSFWIALLMTLEEGRDGMIFVVTALNLLGKQNSSELEKVGLKAVALNKDSTDIARETGWISDRATQYGTSIITILHRHCPPAEPKLDTSTPGKKKIANPNGKKPITCGRCKMQGHSARNIDCPLNPRNENAPPS